MYRIASDEQEAVKALGAVLNADGRFVAPRTVAGSNGLMTGWVRDDSDPERVVNLGRLFKVERYVASGIGPCRTVDFGFWNVPGSVRPFHVTREVGGLTIRITVPADEKDARAWIVVGWHEDEVLRTRPLRRYGMPVRDRVEIPQGDGTVVVDYQPRMEVVKTSTGFPQTVSQFTAIMAIEFDTSVTPLDDIEVEAQALAEQLIEVWEEHSTELVAEDAGPATAAEAALAERDEPDTAEVISSLI